VHLADVDRRLSEFNSPGLGEIVESQFESFVAKARRPQNYNFTY